MKDADAICGLTSPTLGGVARPGLCADCGVLRIRDGRASAYASSADVGSRANHRASAHEGTAT